jgi:hypothetical protein
MKKLSSISTSLILISLGSTLLLSCEKEPKKRPFKSSFKTFYRVSPTATVPVEVNGVTYGGFAHFPGFGTGNSTHLGNCFNYFNQLTYSTGPEAPPAGSVAAPIVDIPGYPVTGGPLPLIQANDFTALPALINRLHIPKEVHGHIISSIIYNDKGDAIFTTAITGGGGTFPISATIVGFNGEGLILGGTGKFRHAYGEFNFNGFF